jgi:hypothetical protein
MELKLKHRSFTDTFCAFLIADFAKSILWTNSHYHVLQYFKP